MEESEISEKKQIDRPWLFKKGQSGNPAGRPKGSKSLKVFAQEYLKGLSDEDKIAFMEGLPKEVVWKMAEGNPKTEEAIEHTGNLGIIYLPKKDGGMETTTETGGGSHTTC